MLKSIFAVSSGSYSDYRVLAVFETKKDAEIWAKELTEAKVSYDGVEADYPLLPEGAQVEEMLLVPKGVAPYKVTHYELRAELWDNGKVDEQDLQVNVEYAITSYEGIPPTRPRVRYIRAPCHENKGGRLEIHGDSEKKVRKVFSEKVAMWKAGQWGGPKHKEINE